MAVFQQIDRARILLSLGEDATIQEIRQAYRRLALKYHPDRCKESQKSQFEEMSKKINQARDVLLTYCAGYKYSFRKRDVEKNVMDKEVYQHLKRFYDGWWGDLDL